MYDASLEIRKEHSLAKILDLPWISAKSYKSAQRSRDPYLVGNDGIPQFQRKSEGFTKTLNLVEITKLC